MPEIPLLRDWKPLEAARGRTLLQLVESFSLLVDATGPKSCSLYKPGPADKAPDRKGMIWEEADWVEKDAVSHRGPDD